MSRLPCVLALSMLMFASVGCSGVNRRMNYAPTTREAALPAPEPAPDAKQGVDPFVPVQTGARREGGLSRYFPGLARTRPVAPRNAGETRKGADTFASRLPEVAEVRNAVAAANVSEATGREPIGLPRNLHPRPEVPELPVVLDVKAYPEVLADRAAHFEDEEDEPRRASAARPSLLFAAAGRPSTDLTLPVAPDLAEKLETKPEETPVPRDTATRRVQAEAISFSEPIAASAPARAKAPAASPIPDPADLVDSEPAASPVPDPADLIDSAPTASPIPDPADLVDSEPATTVEPAAVASEPSVATDRVVASSEAPVTIPANPEADPVLAGRPRLPLRRPSYDLADVPDPEFPRTYYRDGVTPRERAEQAEARRAPRRFRLLRRLFGDREPEPSRPEPVRPVSFRGEPGDVPQGR